MTGRDILKAMAQQAKDRLRGKSEKITNIKYNKLFNDFNNKSNIKTVIISEDDDLLYNKIKNTLDNDSINPLAELIDFAYYKTLTNEQKERYFFKLADKYRMLKRRYESEKLKEVN